VAGKEIAVKKYVVRLSAGERGRLNALTRAGKCPAQLLRKARILLKADVSEAGEGWSDSAISAALDTSVNNIGSRIGDRGTDREDELLDSFFYGIWLALGINEGFYRPSVTHLGANGR
jgi:hypothetical protein